MYPFVRWASVLAKNRLKPTRAGILDESVLSFHVWPGDLDFFGHMNNGRYLSLMDSGRWDVMDRLGLIGTLRRNRWIVVLGAATIQFLRPLAPFRRFELRSRIVGWDEKWFYVRQEFVHAGKTVALAWVRGLFRAKDRSVPTREILDLVHWDGAAPRLPEVVRQWVVALDAERGVGERV